MSENSDHSWLGISLNLRTWSVNEPEAMLTFWQLQHDVRVDELMLVKMPQVLGHIKMLTQKSLQVSGINSAYCILFCVSWSL